jgi:hypothetical protein
VNLPHFHQWEPYHLTEIFYTTGQASHYRLFECCLICGTPRVKNLAPGEIPPLLDLQKEES